MAATTDKTISVTEFRNKMQAVIEDCADKGQRYKLLCRNEVAAVLVSPAEWAMITETLAILEDRDLMDQIRESCKDIDAGAARPAEDVFDEIEGSEDGEERQTE